MDVRHLNFLARQPSAKLRERASFWGMPKRGIALILANAMFWQPLIVQAEGIAVSGGTSTSTTQAGNGVPIVNIATPNATGLSHNQYQQYNVGAEGVILNNATARTQNTQLGGIVVGNPNFNGTAAGTILNEVVGANASQLKGYTEVAGQAARVIVANPHGISCDGCGFINTPRVTLTTGKPVLDNGRLDRFQVDGGSVSVDGAGLNADNVDQFEIITRATQINAQINARQLTVIAGRNDVDAQTLNPTARADDGSAKPGVAIDSSALGGMYAGAIRLVGTEAGVGVRLAGNLAASAGDIQIDANGQLNLAQTSAANAVNVKATSLDAAGPVYAGTSLTIKTSGDMTTRQNIAARDAIQLDSGGQLTNIGVIEAGVNADNTRNASGDIAVTAQNLRNSGSLTASRALTAQVSKTLDNRGGTLNSQAQTRITAATLDNRNGEVSSRGDLSVSGGQLDNSGGGRLLANGDVALTFDGVNNQAKGVISGQRDVQLNVGQLSNTGAGNVSAKRTLNLTASRAVDNTQGTLRSDGTLDLRAASLGNNGGSITSADALALTTTDAIVNQGGEISSNSAFTLTASALQNTDGTVLSKQALVVRVGQQLNNVRGLVSGTGVAVTAAELINDNGTLGSDADLSVTTSGQLSNRGGEVSAAGTSVLNAASLDNTGGQVTADQRLNLNLGGALNNQAGTLGAGQGLSIQAASLDNRQAGVLVTDADLGITLGGALDNRTGGSVQAKGPLSLKSLALDNRGGRLSTQSSLNLGTGSADNRGGLIRADQAMQLAIEQLDNSQQGVINGKAGIRLSGQRLDNQNGLLSAVGPMQLQVNDVRNGAGRIASQTDMQATVDTLSQQGGQLVAQGTLHLTGQHLDNRAGGLVGATKALTLDVADIDNRAGEISGQVDVAITGQQLDNSDGGKLLAGTTLALSVQRVINRNKGLVFGDTLRLDGQSLDNAGGTLASRNDLTLALSGDLNNSAGLLDSEGALSLRASSLENAAGSISSAAALDIATLGALRNQGGSISTDATLTLASASLDNRNAGTLSGKGATRVDTGAFDNSQGGRLTSSDRLTLDATQVSNRDGGRIASALALNATVTGLDQQGGQLFSNTALSLDLNHGLLNNQNGLINAPGALVLSNLGDVVNRQGEISSAQAFVLTVQNLDNSAGKLLSNQGLALRVEHALNNLEGTVAAEQLDISSESLDNGKGLISSRSGLNLVVGALMNQSGTVIADGDLLLKASTANNDLGQISSRKNLVAQVTRLQQQSGQLIAQGTLNLAGSTLDNRLNGLIGATGALTVDVGDVDNRGGELSSQDAITLNGQRLDNSDGGRVLAQRALTLTVAGITNGNQGLLSSQTDVSVVGNTFNNGGGKLLGLANLDIGLTGQLSNTRGLISSEGTLNARVGSLDNTSGSLSSAGPLTLDSAGALGNQAGELVTDGALNLRSASLDNRAQGRISSKGVLTITTGAFDNSQAGRVSSGDRLDLTSAQLTNRDGGSIGSGQALTATVGGLDQQGGTLFSNAALTLDLNNGALNNQGGLINAVGPLLLKNLNAVANQSGEISSAQAFTLTAQRLDNSAGKVLSNQALTLRVAQALDNVKGMIAAARLDATANTLDNSGGTLTSRGDLALTTTGLLTNHNDGLINAAQALTVRAGALDNQAGQLLGGSALTLDTTTLNNTAKGLINSQGRLILTAERLDSSDGGEVSAHGDLGLTLNALTQTNGRLLGDAGLSLDLNGADLNNRAGLINAKGPLTFNRLGNVNNQGGEISAVQSFTLAGRAFDNTSGRLISNTALTVDTSSVINQNGLISGWQGLSLISGTLDNRSNGTLSSRSGDVSARLSGALLNGNGGALVSQKTLTVNAQSLDNRGGILSSGAGQSLVTSGVLDNSQNGSIDSGGALTLQAAQLANVAGSIAAQQDLSFTGNALDNSNGNLVGKGALTLDLIGALTNTNGKLASGGLLRVLRASQIGNQGGQLVSQGLMNLSTGSLDNRNRGTVAANGSLLLTSSGAVLNSGDGLIYSQTADVQLQAASLANANGTLQSQGALGVNVTSDIDNQNGRIIAQNGDLSLGAANLDSRGGVLSSLQGAFTARVSGVLKNGYDASRQGGVIQAQRLDLAALGGFDNYGGRVSARSGDALIRANNFDNRNGALYAKGRVSFTGDNFDNSGDNDGQIAGRQIDLTLNGALNNRFGVIESDTTLNITAASLDNQTGKIRALGNTGATRFNIGGTFDNRNGTLESASTDFDFNVGGFLNAGGSLLHVGTGELGISTANVTNAGGSIVTRGGLTLNADSWTNSSVLQAGRLTVNVSHFTQTATGQLLAANAFTGTGSNWANDGLIASDGSLSLNIGGTYSGNGRMTSLGDLTLGAAQLNLSNLASIAGGGSTGINVGNQLTNYGRLTSAGDLTLNAGRVESYGTLGAAGALTLTASSLLNDHALIFSGNAMSLRVSDFSNQYADVYSLSNLSIDRDGAGGRANSIVNSSSSIQSDGAMRLAASTIQNIRALLTVNNAGTYTAKVTEIACIEGVNAGDCGGKRNHVWEMVLRDKLEVTAASAASTITSGGDLTLVGGDLLNQSSTLSSGGAFTATLDNLTNSGLESSDTERSRVFRTQRTSNAGGYTALADAVTDKYWYESSGYDANDLSGLEGAVNRFIAVTETELTQFNTTRTLSSGDQSYAAIIQAAGAVNITTRNNFDNSVVRAGYNYASSGARANTTAAGTNAVIRINLNQQLPPDLAQQQVNPLSLPGFSLPTGQNGLFRLSGQAGSTTQATQATNLPQSWTLGGVSVSLAQREQAVPDAQARSVQIGAIGPLSTAIGQLDGVARQSAGISANASTFAISAPVDAGNGAFTVPGHQSDANAMTAVGGVPGITPITSASAQTVSRVQGVPSSAAKPNGNKYLIETNPVLTDLKQFMSSDYLLAGLGYDPDQSAKRLGDGFYEQRLVQQAITARTGQAFIDGQTSNEAQFRYLMNNAIASKNALDLAVGVSLTSQQVAALTHDIVWLEEHEVNGEKVLVPVLYLAQADNRLAPNGALIAGNDVTLIAGQNLDNVGTLRATNNLAATAGNNLVNSGLIEAGNRLNLLAGNDVINKAGGIIAGRDVSITAVKGDIINERSLTGLDSTLAGTSHRDYADSAARIEAANDLSLGAGRDITNSGSALQSSRDLSLTAGRDVNLVSTQVGNSLYFNAKNNQSDITQVGSTVSAGRDLSVQAGRDINVIASQIDAKRDIAMAATENLTLSSAADEEHSYSKTKKVTAQQDNVRQVASTVTAGGSVALSAGNDLSLIASKVSAQDEAYVYAGNDLNLLSAQETDYSYYAKTKKGSWGKKSSTMTETESITSVGSAISSATKLVVSAGQDVTAVGAKLSSDGALVVKAGGDIVLAAAEDYSGQASAKSSKGLLSGKSKTASQSQSTLIGTELQGQSVSLQADRDITLNAAGIYADQAARLDAGRDVSIGSAESQQTASQSSSKSKLGMSWYGMPSLAQSAAKGQQVSTQSIGSSISADTLQVNSGRDTTVSGSTLVADRALGISAGRDLSIVSSENTASSQNSSSSKKQGDIGSWWQPAVGVASAKSAQANSSTQQSGSQLASLSGDINLSAGKNYNQVASQVLAPKGDISIKAEQVNILAGFDLLSANQSSSSSKTAIGGTVTVPLLDAARDVQRSAQSVGTTADPRMQALAAANTAMSAQRAYEAGQDVLSDKAGIQAGIKGGIKVGVNLSTSNSKSKSSQSGSNVVGSSVAAGGDITIAATGAGKDSTLNVIGSQISAGRDTNLRSDGDINLAAAQNIARFDSSNSNSGASVGVSFNLGAQNGFTLDLAANKGQGMGKGNDVSQTNTQITAGQAVNLNSAGDTSLSGAVIKADQVRADVGGDLTLTSLRDSSDYTSKQQSISASASVCIPGFCGGASSGSASFNQQKMNSDYASVIEQTAIKAGDGGFQVNVGGNTGLVGAIIASSDKAVADGKNSLSTGTFTSVDVKNKAEYNASSIGLSGGVGGTLGRDGDGKIAAGAPGPKPASIDNMSANAPVALVAKGDASSTTRSGISGATITIRDSDKQQALTGQTSEQATAAVNTNVSSDRDSSNALKPIFDAKEIQAGFDITGKFVQNVGQFLENKAKEADKAKQDYQAASAKANDPSLNPDEQQAYRDQALALRDQAKAIDNDWGAGGTYRQIATALVAAASGNVTAGNAQFVQNMVVNYVQQQGAAYIGKLVAKGELAEGSPLHATLHAIVGCAGAAASNQACSAGAVGGSASSMLAGLFNEADPNESREAREAKRNIITSLVTGIAAMGGESDVAAVSNSATANVDNNWLATQQLVQFNKEMAEADSWTKQALIMGKWAGTSIKQDALTSGGIGLGLAQGGVNDIQGMATFLQDPLAGLKGMYAAVSDPAIAAQIGNDAVVSLQSSIQRMEYALQVGGDDQAVALGKDLGLLIYTVGSTVAGMGVGGAAKAGMALGKAGVEVSSKTLGQLAEKSGIKVSEDIAQLEASTQHLTQDIAAAARAKAVPKPTAGGNLAELAAADKDIAVSGAKGTESSVGKASEANAPGMDRPFRQVNPEFPPNKSVVDAMGTPQIKNMVNCSSTDCSDIASKLFEASGGKGKIIEVRPLNAGNLNVYENGVTEPGQFYHQVYTDGQYVYDPRLSSNPIPKGDWEQHIRNINPDGVVVSDKLKGLK